ncbi:DUF3427 domain-containing protein [Pseudonocardia sp. RS010]|uniref:DUF3427 domain-containing protein n=1 Tax=Pseudonocardia sp. RS010 TaxID=3385979 RepID=UPI0039A1E2FF
MLAALNWASLERKAHRHAAGVVWAPQTRTDAFFVNLRKTERDFSPTTLYRDYAQRPDLFHWESQNATTSRPRLAPGDAGEDLPRGERGGGLIGPVRSDRDEAEP